MRFRWAAEPAGTIFIRLLLSLVLPLAMSALVLAVAELQPGSLVGMGGRLVGLTVGLTSVAVAIGVVVASYLIARAERNRLLEVASADRA